MTGLDCCDRCKAADAVVHAYWGAAMCRRCARLTADELDRRGAWPPAPWSDTDLRELADGR